MIGFIESWEQAVTWLALLVVLYAVISEKLRYDLTAFGCLLLLGVLGLRTPGELFSGFSSPALFTIAVVLVMSAGIVESGLLSGLGKKIAAKIHRYPNQILAVFLSTGLISAFMNNVGAVGIILPTAKRMAQRAKIPQASFGIPIVYASILGGSCTLIGTASNLIVSTYRLSAFGKPFMMFDFSLYGLAMLFSGILVLFLCRVCGIQTIDTSKSGIDNPGTREAGQAQDPPPRNRKKSLIVLFTLVTAVVLTGTGLVHPSVAFGLLTLFWIFSGVLSYRNALENVNIPIIIFLGSMFGISGILEETGALKAAVNIISPLFVSLPPFLLILIFLYVTALFANILDNSVAALLMAPVAVALWRTGAVSFNPDALLLAVAAGASLGIVMPTHQATIVVMSGMDFPRKSFMKAGAAIAAVAGTSSAFVIYTLWC
jgi:di/tricarboxylate transporter